MIATGLPDRPGLRRRCGESVAYFVGRPASARPLATLRIGVSVILLAQGFALYTNLLDLCGSQGIVQRPITDALVPVGVPRINWVAEAVASSGISEQACVRGLFILYMASLACLLVGWRTRLAAVLAWLTHLVIMTSGTISTYGVDGFANIVLFYCVWMPVGHSASLDLLTGRVQGRPSAEARLGLRVVQIHLCIVYLTTGLEKAVGSQWWDGHAVWYALMQPKLGQFDFSWLAALPWLVKLVCWGTLVVEIGYPIFVWPRRTRKLWAMATIGLHAGIAVTLGLVSFSALMIVLTLSAFLISTGPSARTECQEALLKQALA